MKFVEYSVKNPVVIVVGVIFLLLFGYLAIVAMPYSLTPNISRPTISISTTWAGATPYEMEKEIVQRQEKFLKNLPNLISLTSTSREGSSSVNLEFEVGTDMKKALLDTSSKLSEVRGYPSNIDNPVIRSTGESIAPVVYLFVKAGSLDSIKSVDDRKDASPFATQKAQHDGTAVRDVTQKAQYITPPFAGGLGGGSQVDSMNLQNLDSKKDTFLRLSMTNLDSMESAKGRKDALFVAQYDDTTALKDASPFATQKAQHDDTAVRDVMQKAQHDGVAAAKDAFLLAQHDAPPLPPRHIIIKGGGESGKTSQKGGGSGGVTTQKGGEIIESAAKGGDMMASHAKDEGVSLVDSMNLQNLDSKKDTFLTLSMTNLDSMKSMDDRKDASPIASLKAQHDGTAVRDLTQIAQHDDTAVRDVMQKAWHDDNNALSNDGDTALSNDETKTDSVRRAYTYLYEDIVNLYERLDGVGMVDILGGVAKQVEVILNTKQLAFYNITLDDVINAMQAHNINVSAGSLDYGQRAYRVRTIGLYESSEDVYNTIVKTDNAQVVYLRDIAEVIDTYELPKVPNIHNNDETISLQIRPTAGANVLELIDKVRELTNRLNEKEMKEHNLRIEWGRDSAPFIKDAIALVRHDIILGVILAAIVLYAFLRSLSSVFLVSVIIPISILSSFILLHAMGRSLNVILLAGVSFAISMIIDSSIVVVENIHRHRSMGKRMFESCIDGTKEVLGALFASTITTVAIFIPIIGLKDEIGQLFSDIALASSSALLIAMVICIVVIPSFYYSLVKFLSKKDSIDSSLESKSPRIFRICMLYLKKFKRLIDSIFLKIGEFFYNIIVRFLEICLKSVRNRILCVSLFAITSLYITYLLIPKLDYLPKGSQNFLVANIQTPNGLSYAERDEIIHEIYAYNAPYMLENGFKGDATYPAIKDFYITGGSNNIYFYEISADSKRYKELIKLMQDSINRVPNISGNVVEQGIFSASGISENVEVNIIGADLDSMLISAAEFNKLARENLKGARVRAVPSIDANNREINLYPDMRSLAVNGLSVKSFGNIVDVLVDGKKIGDFRNNDGKIIDLVLRSDNTTQSPEDILYSQIYAPSGQIVPLSSLADVAQDIGLSQIRHYEQDRNILFYINPQDSMSLQEVIETIDNVIVPKMRDNGTLQDNRIVVSGNANKLYKLAKHLSGGFLLALVITYLLLTALYANFLYPIIIIFSVPFALTGGFMGLWFVDKFIAHQNLDVLTMLGFIILVGSVVNNAILIVYQSLINLREYKMSVFDSVFNATTSRIRPIYMGMLTSILALAPLIFSSGAGSEIYRGLGAVIAGGILISTIISIFVIPSLLLFALKPANTKVV